MEGMFAVLGAGLLVEEELMERLWSCKNCRYPSFSIFFFNVEFQWFLMALSVLRRKYRADLTLAL